MSVVSNVIIITKDSQHIIRDNIELLNEWLKEYYDGDINLFKSVNDCLISSEHDVLAGTKYLEATLFAGAFNFLPDDFYIFFKSLHWDHTVMIISPDDKEQGLKVIQPKWRHKLESKIHLDGDILNAAVPLV